LLHRHLARHVGGNRPAISDAGLSSIFLIFHLRCCFYSAR
jgi:hypothetical protein